MLPHPFEAVEVVPAVVLLLFSFSVDVDEVLLVDVVVVEPTLLRSDVVVVVILPTVFMDIHHNDEAETPLPPLSDGIVVDDDDMLYIEGGRQVNLLCANSLSCPMRNDEQKKSRKCCCWRFICYSFSTIINAFLKSSIIRYVE